MKNTKLTVLAFVDGLNFALTAKRCILDEKPFAMNYQVIENEKLFCSGCPKTQECIVANELPELEALNG